MAPALDGALVDRLLAFVAPHYRTRDPAHDLLHIERILQRVGALSEGVEPPPRPHLLAFLACFHGLARALREDGRFLAETRALLAGLGWPDDDRAEALELVDRHLTDPRTSEEKVVHDANYAELLGALGIAKAFTTGGARGQHYRETMEVFERQYLDRVEFRTPAGRAWAERERPFVKTFLRKLEQELRGTSGPA